MTERLWGACAPTAFSDVVHMRRQPQSDERRRLFQRTRWGCRFTLSLLLLRSTGILLIQRHTKQQEEKIEQETEEGLQILKGTTVTQLECAPCLRNAAYRNSKAPNRCSDYLFDYLLAKGMETDSAFQPIENGSKGARTPDLSRVRRTLIPAELCFHVLYFTTDSEKCKRKFKKIPKILIRMIFMKMIL